MVTDRLKIGTVDETMARLTAGEYKQWKLLIAIEQEKTEGG